MLDSLPLGLAQWRWLLAYAMFFLTSFAPLTSRADEFKADEILNNEISKYRHEKDVPGISVALGMGGTIVYARGFGYRDVAKKLPATSKTVYRLASVSKPISSTLVLRLIQNNKIKSLQSKASTYATSLPQDKSAITIEQLLAHRSGIRHYDGDESTNKHFTTCTEAMKRFIDDKLKSSPGTDYRYSTHGYTVLGSVIEGATDKTFEEFFKLRLTDGKGLSSLRPEQRDATVPFRSRIYKRSKSKNVEASRDDLSWKYPGGGLESNVRDLTTFGMKLAAKEIVSKSSLEEMWRKRTGSSALGWRVGEAEGAKVVGHSGAQTGAASYLRIYPTKKHVVAVLSNRRGHDVRGLAKTVGAVAISYADHEWQAKKFADQYSKNSPALAVYRNQLHMVHLGKTSNDLWHSTFDGKTWSQNQKINGQTSKSPPALAVYNDRLHMVHLGNSSNEIWHSRYDGKGWTYNKKVGQLSKDAPALAVHGGLLHMVHLGNSSNDIWHSKFNGETWSPNKKIGQTSKYRPALVSQGSCLRMVHLGNSSNSIYYSKLEGPSWTQNVKIDGQLSKASPALVSTGKECYMFHLGNSSNDIWYSALLQSDEWQRNIRIPGQKSSAPVAVAEFNGKTHVVYKGSGSTNLWHAMLSKD